MKALLAGCALVCANAYADDHALIERGKYLVDAGDCRSCHTAPGGKAFAGGRGITTPFGTIYTPNLTPDPVTGIGAWSDDDFYRALHTGIDRNGEHLYPAFPYPWYTKLTRADVHAMRAWLATLPAVEQRPPPNELNPLVRSRALIGVWNKLYFHEGEFEPRADKSPQWNRGAYLIEGFGHCSACHSPKNLFGAVKHGHEFEGGEGDNWFAPNLTASAKDGAQTWRHEQLVEYLRSGTNRHTAATGPMAEVIGLSTQHLNKSDLDALATYLQDLPNRSTPSTASRAPQQSSLHERGAGIYIDNCAGCHQQNGRGIPGAIPSLAGSAIAQADTVATAARTILEGGTTVATKTKPAAFAMPAFADKLSDEDVAAVLSFVRQAWNNRAAPVAPADIEHVRATIAAHPSAPNPKH